MVLSRGILTESFFPNSMTRNRDSSRIFIFSPTVGGVLLDKRRGQIQQYRMTPETTALLIQQFAAHAVTGKSTSSIVLADGLNVPDRTIRMYSRKLGLSTIVKSLPELVTTLKKTHSNNFGNRISFRVRENGPITHE